MNYQVHDCPLTHTAANFRRVLFQVKSRVYTMQIGSRELSLGDARRCLMQVTECLTASILKRVATSIILLA
jgi:hypothetical protein